MPPTPEEIAAAEKAVAEKAATDKLAADEATKKKAADEVARKKAEDEKKSADERWLKIYESFPDEVKVVYDLHTHGLKSALEKERENAKTLPGTLKRLAELEDAETKRKEAEMTEQEKLESQITKITAEKEILAASLRDTQVKSTVLRLAVKLLFKDPEDAFTMIKEKLVSITEVSAEADTKIEGLLGELSKSKPYLLEKSRGDGFGTPQGRGKPPLKEESMKSSKPLIKF